jgi:hypothetical protein
MSISKYAACTLILTSLAACGGSSNSGSIEAPTTPPTPAMVVGSAANTGGAYSVVQGTTTTTLPSGGFSLNGQPAWATGTTRANAYESGNVLAIGGVQSGTSFAGISGTPGAVPATGTATYTGRYAVNSAASSQSGALALNADFDAGTIADNTTAIDVAGTITGSEFAGTVTFGGDTADLSGGFYGTNEMAGAFAGDNIGGVIYGSAP